MIYFASLGEGGMPGMTWPPALPFARVLDRARKLDSAATGQLYARFLPVVYRYVLARVGDVHTAEDLTSDTFFAMVEQISTARAQDELSFAAWLLGIARNKVLMHYRRRRTGPTFAPELDDDAHPSAYAEEDDPLAIITARESWSEVVGALNRLTEEQRTVVLYRCVLGYSTDEVAGLMGKKAGTIRALQFRALASLARLLTVDEAAALRRKESR
jgi:RNA polymerase sigma-70 factor (ECF subfamily)